MYVVYIRIWPTLCMCTSSCIGQGILATLATLYQTSACAPTFLRSSKHSKKEKHSKRDKHGKKEKSSKRSKEEGRERHRSVSPASANNSDSAGGCAGVIGCELWLNVREGAPQKCQPGQFANSSGSAGGCAGFHVCGCWWAVGEGEGGVLQECQSNLSMSIR